MISLDFSAFVARMAVVRPYGNSQAESPMDRKRRYVNRALRAGDLREDRAAKRRERTAGNAEIRVDVEAMVDEEAAPLSGSIGGDD